MNLSKLKPKVSLHNEFDIEVKDTKTGEVKKYKAYNIVLDSQGTNFASLSTSSVTQIHVGDGTGTLDVTRTSLFNLVIRKNHSHVDRGFNAETLIGWEKKNIILGTQEAVGVEFTEVGLGRATDSDLRTHAFIEDSEGNPITLEPKTNTEEITFYATWYYKLLGNNIDGIEYTGDKTAEGDSDDNGIIRLLKALANPGASSLSSTIKLSLGSARRSTRKYKDGGVGNKFAYQEVSSNKKDIAATVTGKQRKYDSVVRYESAQGNGEIWELNFNASTHASVVLNPIMRIQPKNLPASIWDGITFADEEIGTGDGVETGFNLKWNLAENETIKVNAVAKTAGTDYTKNLYNYDSIIDYWHIDSWEDLVALESGSINNLQVMLNGTITSSSSDIAAGSEFSIDLGESKKWGIGAIDISAQSTFYYLEYIDVWVSSDRATWTLVAENIDATPSATDVFETKELGTATETEFRYIKIKHKKAAEASIKELRFRTRLNQIEFTTPPPSGEAVTGTYTIKEYIPKDEGLLLDISGPTITFGHENPV